MFDKMILHGYRDVNKPAEDYDAATNSKGDFKIAPNSFVTYRVAFEVPLSYDVINWDGLDKPVLKPINMSVLGLEEPYYEDVIIENIVIEDTKVPDAEIAGGAVAEAVIVESTENSDFELETSSEVDSDIVLSEPVEQKLVIPSPISVTFNGAPINFVAFNEKVGFQQNDYHRFNGLVKGRILENVSGFTGEDVAMNEIEKVALAYTEAVASGNYEVIEDLIYVPEDTYITPITLFHKLEPIQVLLNTSYPFTSQANMHSYEVGNDLFKYTCYETIVHYKNIDGESDMLKLVVMKDTNGDYKVDLSAMFK